MQKYANKGLQVIDSCAESNSALILLKQINSLFTCF